MKKIAFLSMLFVSFFSIGQTSYYFSGAIPPDAPEAVAVDKRFHGTYKSEDGRVYEINTEGIFVISVNISSISRETIRESSHYKIEGDYLYGVVENEAVPCVLEGENYYFGLKNKTELIGRNSINILKQSVQDKGVYYINFPSEDAFVPTRLRFEKQKLQISSFDYELETELFNGIAARTVVPSNYSKLVLLQPTAAEFDALLEKGVFGTEITYTKE